MKIKHMLGAISIIVFLGFATLMLCTQALFIKIENAIEASKYVAEVKADMLMLRRNEKDFLARKELKYQKYFNSNFQTLTHNLKTLENRLDQANISLESLVRLTEAFDKYKQGFSSLVNIQQQIGLNETEGAYGELRQAAKRIQAVTEKTNQAGLTSQLLLLRRHEKDFMLRLDMQYANKFDKQINEMKKTLSSYPNIQSRVLPELKKYENSFQQFVSLSNQKGLSENQGISELLRKEIKATELLLEEEATFIEKQIISVRTNTKNILLVLSISLTLLISIIIFIVARTITQRLSQATSTMNDIAKGEGDLRVKLNDTGKDEFAELGKAFNSFVQKIHSTVTTVVHATEQLSTTSEELAVVTEQTLKGISQQKMDTEMVATAMNEMATTVHDVANNAAKASEAANQAEGEARSGTVVIQHTIGSINALSESVNDSSKKLNEVQKEVINISSILQVIREIAEQTNLLALNAAIEAARAGAQGRGFAVVADEVRSLAERTQNSTSEIQDIIEQLQAGTQSTVEAMSLGKNQAANCVEETKKANEALEAITEAIRVINDMNMQIASASEQQSSVAENINKSVVNVKRVAEENAVASSQTTNSSSEIARLAEDLGLLVSQFKV